MRTWIIGVLTVGTLLTAAIPAAAQTRPHVSGSESSRNSGPTCTVNGDASACETSSMGGAVTPLPGPAGTVSVLPGPVIIGAAPILGPVLGGDASGRASTDTDVNRSSRPGSALTR